MRKFLLIVMVLILVLTFGACKKAGAAGSLADVFVPAPVTAMEATQEEMRATWTTPIWDWSADMIIGNTLTAGVGTNLVGYKDMLFLRAEGVGNTDEGKSFITDGAVGGFMIADIKKVTEGLGVVSWIPSWMPHVGVGAITYVDDNFGTAWKVRGFLKIIGTDMIFDGIERLFSSEKK